MKSFRRASAYIGLGLLVVLAILIYSNAQSLSDWWRLRGYDPPPAVSKLSKQDTMTDYARRIFYVNHPQLEANASQIRTDCGETEKTIILGCYHGNQQGIFIYDVTDQRLNGIEQVTAAHEMLHSAYDRLSDSDKNYVDGLLQKFYKTVRDQRIIDEVNGYEETEPDAVVNEMHSIFGTEVASLPAPLENYYDKYFTNRRVVTDFASNYRAEFTSREGKVKADDARLSQMKVQIDAQEKSLNSQLKQINADRAKLDSLRNSGQIDKYNAMVQSFNSEVEAYNAGVGELKEDIASYNRLVAERNSIAADLASLGKSIDTRLTTQSAQ